MVVCRAAARGCGGFGEGHRYEEDPGQGGAAAVWTVNTVAVTVVVR